MSDALAARLAALRARAGTGGAAPAAAPQYTMPGATVAADAAAGGYRPQSGSYEPAGAAGMAPRADYAAPAQPAYAAAPPAAPAPGYGAGGGYAAPAAAPPAAAQYAAPLAPTAGYGGADPYAAGGYGAQGYGAAAAAQAPAPAPAYAAGGYGSVPTGAPPGYAPPAGYAPAPGYGAPGGYAAAKPVGDVNSRANDLLRAVRGNVANIDAARKRVQSVDIAFLIDCTGSMQHWIDRTKDTVMDILDRLRGLYPEAQLRTAFVGYRDFEPKDNNASSYVVEQFMPPEYLRERIALVTAKGGDDVAEDVIGGLAKIPNLEWQSKARVLIHIADAPPHGHRFHLGKYTDRFANGPDPNGKRPQDFEEVIRQIVNKQVDYYFFKCHPCTDIFEAEVRENIFRRWFPSCKFEVIPLGSDDRGEFLERIMTATRSSMRSAGIQ